MLFKLTTVERKALAIIALLTALGLVGMALHG
jgi:hypothetical protein